LDGAGAVLYSKKGLSNASTLRLGDDRLRYDTTVMHESLRRVRQHAAAAAAAAPPPPFLPLDDTYLNMPKPADGRM
jgi:hypothetical protein